MFSFIRDVIFSTVSADFLVYTYLNPTKQVHLYIRKKYYYYLLNILTNKTMI